MHAMGRAALAGVLLLTTGCGLVGGLVRTQIEIKSGQRTLEEQILGAYDQLGEEVYQLAGVRAVDPISGLPTPPPPMTRSEAEALDARRRMEFNRDDVSAFRVAGYVGEGNDGMLVVMRAQAEKLRESDPRLLALVEGVVQEENEDRMTTMQRIVDTNPDLKGEEGLLTVRRILAARQRQDADSGTMIQLPDGTWTTAQERP